MPTLTASDVARPEATGTTDPVRRAEAAAGTGTGRPQLRRPGAVLVLVVAVVALLAERALIGTGALSGGRLLPAPAGAADLWHAWLAPDGEPRLALLALLATALLGRADLAVDLLLLLSVPLSAWTAWAASRHVVASPLLRSWLGATWALLPVATGGLAAGRLETAVVQIALPVLLLAAEPVLGSAPRRRDWRRAAALALGLTLVAAFSPALWIPAAVLLLGAAAGQLASAPAGRRPTAARRLLHCAAAVAAPVVVLLPGTWLPGLAPLLAGPGLPRPDLAAVDLPAVHLLLLSPGGPGLPPVPVAGGLLVAALAGLLVTGRPRLAATGWGIALTGLAYALLLARSDSAGPVWPGAGLQVAAAGLLLSAVAGADGLAERLRQVSFGWRQVSAVLVVAVAACVPVLCATTWIARGADGPLQRGQAAVLPAYVRADLAATGERSLVLRPRPDGVVAYAVAEADGARLGDPGASSGAEDAGLAITVGDLMTARGSAAAAQLADRGVRWVAFLAGSSDPAAEDPRVAGLDAQPGLVRESAGTPLLWRVVAPPSAVPAASARAGTDLGRAAWQAGALLALAACAARRPALAGGLR